jgi:REP element-mobilizing transposase RayT
MLHFAPRARPGSKLFRTWAEARALWDALTQRVPATALVVMPDHVHLLASAPNAASRLAAAMNAYAQWRNHQRGERGPVWKHRDAATPVRAGQHRHRTLRYLYLNPCRAGLVDDPLAWPFSTYRDAVGLAIPALHRARPDPAAFHAHVSADATTDLAGTPLPSGSVLAPGTARLHDVVATVSSLTRTPLADLRRPGPPRRLLLRAAREIVDPPARALATLLHIHPTIVRRSWSRPHPDAATVAQVLGDPRFAALDDGVL